MKDIQGFIISSCFLSLEIFVTIPTELNKTIPKSPLF